MNYKTGIEEFKTTTKKKLLITGNKPNDQVAIKFSLQLNVQIQSQIRIDPNLQPFFALGSIFPIWVVPGQLGIPVIWSSLRFRGVEVGVGVARSRSAFIGVLITGSLAGGILVFEWHGGWTRKSILSVKLIMFRNNAGALRGTRGTQ